MRRRLVAMGGWLFRYRSYTPILWFLLLMLCTFRESHGLVAWGPGLLLLALGEGLRILGVAVIGKESRTRGSGVRRLVTAGPFASVRNPLYLGNLLIMLGVTFLSELLWLVPVAAALFAVQYVPIVLWEEQTLQERFGGEYTAYCQQVPRWIPRWSLSGPAAAPSYQWRAALWSERSTFGTIAVLLLLMLAKEHRGPLPKFWQKHMPHSTTSAPFSKP